MSVPSFSYVELELC